MKKIFTLLFATGMISAAFAQYDQREQRDYGYNNKVDKSPLFQNGNNGYDNDHNYGHGDFNGRERERQIELINRQFDHEIMEVRNRFFMGYERKERKIMALEEQRHEAIDAIIHKFNEHWNGFDGRRNDYSHTKFERKEW